MSIFVELSLILVLATVIAGIMRLFKQPLIMGYILTGFLIGPLALGFVESTETVQIFSEFGIAILLFIVGIHLSPNVAKEVGKVAILTGIGQILLTSFLGFSLAKLLGFGLAESLYIAAAVTFSSTIIVLKILSDKKDIEKLYAKIAIGILLVQDVAATLALVFAATFSTGEGALTNLLLLLIKGLLLTAIITLVALKMLPKLSSFFAKSQEFLFLFALGWGFGLASLFSYIGFSIEIGALIAGVALSISPYAPEISSRLKPLRDFFIIMFFVFLGAQMSFESLQNSIIPLLLLVGLVLLIKPFIIIALMGILGYNKKTSFFSGASLAQISEFSLILVLVGISSKHIDNDILSLVTILALITIAFSTYFLKYIEKTYPLVSKYLSIFERKKPKKEQDILASYEVVLFGCNRVGYDFLRLFKKLGQSFLVVDFDPDVISDLTKEGINSRYGDAEDADFIDDLNLKESKMVISTIPDFDANLFLVTKIKSESENTAVILISYSIDEALKLYEKGANYIILPHFTGGHFAAMIAAKHWLHIDRFKHERDKQIEYLKERKKLGHKHPDEV